MTIYTVKTIYIYIYILFFFHVKFLKTTCTTVLVIICIQYFTSVYCISNTYAIMLNSRVFKIFYGFSLTKTKIQ